MEDNNRLVDERHGVGGPLLVSDPGHINEFSRWFVQSMGETFNPDFNGDPLSVLDTRMLVRGVGNLRVCDMSAVPNINAGNINAGNTNAPAMMLGDSCADLVLEC